MWRHLENLVDDHQRSVQPTISMLFVSRKASVSHSGLLMCKPPRSFSRGNPIASCAGCAGQNWPAGYRDSRQLSHHKWRQSSDYRIQCAQAFRQTIARPQAVGARASHGSLFRDTARVAHSLIIGNTTGASNVVGCDESGSGCGLAARRAC
jgi:hypothetical protein